MKKIIVMLTVLLSFVCLAIHAQFSSANSIMRKEIVSYSKNDKGIYVKTENKMTDVVNGVVENYAYDKKTQNLYVLTETTNVVVKLTKDYAKIIKKNKQIPQLSGEKLSNVIEEHNNQLFEKFAVLNLYREKQITDSIIKARQDSIDEVNRRNAIKARKDYVSSHKWNEVPLGGNALKCDICDEYILTHQIFGIRNDSIYYTSIESGKLGLSYVGVHQSKIPSILKNNRDFLYHYDVFKDSLTDDSTDYAELVRYADYKFYVDYLARLKKAAPYGFVDEWRWGNEYSMVTFNMSYTNTNSKTIKYLTVYFKITNDVGDIRTIGSFQGTGPVKEWETASWNWDSSFYFTSGDASHLNITKIVLTYMNGTKQVVRGKYLQFN